MENHDVSAPHAFIVGLDDEICDIHGRIHATSRNGELHSIEILWRRCFIVESRSVLHCTLINILYC